MTILKSLLAGAALVASSAAVATPVTLGGESPDLQTVINNLYLAGGTPTAQAPDVNANQLSESGRFQIEASGGSLSTMVIEVAGNAGSNTFGVYDITNPANFLQIFSGPDSSGQRASLYITESIPGSFEFSLSLTPLSGVQFGGRTFGYYLGSANGPMFYSEDYLNGGDDHMVAFQGDGQDVIKLATHIPKGVWGKSSYLLAWEDVSLGTSDRDYQDMVVYVESVTPVPEPGSAALLGLAGLGMAASLRRRKNKQS